jgi:MBG domain-containing protein
MRLFMLHKNWNNFLRAVCFAGVLATSAATLRAQSPQPSIAPIFSFSANGLTSAQAYQGWALLLDAEVSHPNLYSTSTIVTPLLINPQNGSWANTIHLVVTDSTGATLSWPIQLATIPSGSLSLDATKVGRLAWVVAPSDTAAIAAGSYHVVGILNTSTSAGTTGWNGTRQSNPVSIQVASPPSSPSAQQQEQQVEILARYHLLVGNASQALQDVNALLAQQPNAVGALELQGDILAQTGQTTDALAAYDSVVTSFYQQNPGPLPEAPRSLLVQQRSLRSALLSQSGGRGQPQVAIHLLDQAIQSPGVFFLDLQITNVGNDVAENVVLNRITFQTLAGTGQVIYNNVLSPQLPSFTDFLSVNASATVRIFVTAQGTVNGFSITENGTTADIFGTPYSFSQTQTASLNFNGNLGLLTITANNATQQYGQPSPSLNSATYSGFVNGDTPASLGGTLNCTTTATQSSPVGTYPITCSGQTSAAYTITYVPGTLTVTPAPLTVTAKNVFSLYGQAAVLNGASDSGFANGDTAASLNGTLNCTTTATSVSPVGTYTINCSGLTSTNYTISFVQGALTITPAPLTIAANNESRAYGVANPLLNSVTASGFVNGDTLLSLTGTLICTTPATPASPAGAYTITCSGLTSPNYSITYLPGTLSITGDALTITASNAIRQYGYANPSLNNVTYSGFVNGDTPASLSGTLICVTSATPTSPVGAYSITCSGLTSANYSISFAPGTLTIAPAPLTIAAGSSSRFYGANNPVPGGVVSGLQNADPITATFTTTAIPASPVGTYPITPIVSDPSNRLGNYAVSLVNGTLSLIQETTTLAVAVLPTSIPVGQYATVTVTLTAPDMAIPIPNDPTVLAAITVTSPSFPSDILSNNGVCTPVPSSIPGVASCTITVTSVEPNGRTLSAGFAGSADLIASSSTANLIVTAALQGQQSCIRSDFRNVAVPGGNYLWFNSIFKVRDVSKQVIHISFLKSTAQFQYTDASGNLVTVNQFMPDAEITIDPNAAIATTAFDSVNNVWTTTIPWDLDDNSFLTGMPWLVPAGGLPGDIEPVTVCGTFASDVAGMEIGWRWSAAAYSSFSSDNAVLGIKPMNSDHDNRQANRDNAGTPENFKTFLVAGARGKGSKNYTGSYSGSAEIE